MLADDPPFGANAIHIGRVSHAVGFFAPAAPAVVIAVTVRSAMPGIVRRELRSVVRLGHVVMLRQPAWGRAQRLIAVGVAELRHNIADQRGDVN